MYVNANILYIKPVECIELSSHLNINALIALFNAYNFESTK